MACIHQLGQGRCWQPRIAHSRSIHKCDCTPVSFPHIGLAGDAEKSTNTHLEEPAAVHFVYTAVLLLVACHERVGQILKYLAGKQTRQRLNSTRSTLGIIRLHTCMQSRPTSISRISFLTIEGDFQGVHHQATLIQRPSRLHNIVSGPLSTCGQSEGSQFSRTFPSSTYSATTHNPA